MSDAPTPDPVDPQPETPDEPDFTAGDLPDAEPETDD